MPAPVISHPREPRADDDPGHPIPYLRVIDVATYRQGGGACLDVVVASPLQADERSQTRLLDKLEGYLHHLQSDEFRRDAGGPPTLENTTIAVQLHPDSAPETRELLIRCEAWVADHHARLQVFDLPSTLH
jgi:hypothetical protein